MFTNTCSVATLPLPARGGGGGGGGGPPPAPGRPGKAGGAGAAGGLYLIPPFKAAMQRRLTFFVPTLNSYYKFTKKTRRIKCKHGLKIRKENNTTFWPCNETGSTPLFIG
jgi:hypothetical protein